MNFITGGDSGGVGRGNSIEEDDDEEPQNTGPTGQLFPSPSSSSHHPQHQHQHQPPPRYGWMHGGEPSSRLADNNNNTSDEQQSGSGMMMVVEREHMFDKVVTPSDVGKLNRLVIPKQHAERFFPLDSSSNDKGLLLNFEDRNGKPWRFRYSYWNSSQSYVMTKGWSRFVKDKKLDAGDIVSFHRGVGGSAKDLLFIDWRHRPDAPMPYPFSSNLSFPLSHSQFSVNRNSIHPWNPLFLQSQPAASRSHSNLMLQPSSYPYGNVGGPYHNVGTGSVVNMNMNQGGTSGSVIYFRSGGGAGIPQERNVIGIGIGNGMVPVLAPPAPPAPPPSSVVFESVPVVHGKAAAKRLRLFGVNMDCPISDDEDQEYEHASDQMSPTKVSSNYHHQPTSSSTIPYLQLRPYDEQTEFNQITILSSSSNDGFNKTTKSSSSGMNLDLDI